MKNLLLIILVFFSFSAMSQEECVIEVTEDGNKNLVSLSTIKWIEGQSDGTSNMVRFDRLSRMDVSESLSEIISKCQCGFYVVTNRSTGKQIAIGKLYTDRVVEGSDGRAVILTKDIRTRYEAEESYAAVLAAVAPCNNPSGGSGSGTNQDLGISGNSLTLTGDFSPVDLTRFLDNTDAQTLSLVGSSLSISNGNSVDLSGLSGGSNTDNQQLSLTGRSLALTNGGLVTLPTDIQSLSINGNQLTISNGNTVDLPSGGTDQDLTLTGTTLMLSGDNTDVNLSQFLDNTDNQSLSLSNDMLSIANVSSAVDLTQYKDNTDNQSLSLTGTELSISGGNSVDLSGLGGGGPDTDDQTLSISGNTLSIADGNSVSLSSVNTDNQSLTLDGNNLSISGGNVVDLSSIDSDNQTISVDGSGNLTISNGNTIALPLGSGGDNWGTQVAQSNNSINGDFTSANPGEVAISASDGNGITLLGDGIYASAGGGSIEEYKVGDAMIRATATGVTYNVSNGVGTFIIPEGVKIFSVAVNATDGQTSGGHFQLKFDHTNLSFNTSKDDFFPPVVNVIQTAAGAFGGPSNSLPFIYDEGSSPQTQVIGASNGDLTIKILNASQFSNFTVAASF